MKATVLFVCLLSISTSALESFSGPGSASRLSAVLTSVEHGRVVGGNEATPHSHPYQAGLIFYVNGIFQFGGASLISRNYVLTAAHCVSDGIIVIDEYTVVLGAHNIFDETDGVRYRARESILHPDYVANTLANDIALIKLPVSVELNDKIQIISLPPYSAADASFEGYAATVSGWGKPSEVATNISTVLKEATLGVISNDVCSLSFLPGFITPTIICTDTEGGNSSCQGDSGGPLTTVLNGTKVQIGLVSFVSSLGCESGMPAGFTRVSKYLEWIANNTDINILPEMDNQPSL